MTWRRASQLVVLGTIVVWIGYDLVCWAKEPDAMLSPVIKDAAAERPVLAAGLGLLAGHWLWPQVERKTVRALRALKGR